MELTAAMAVREQDPDSTADRSSDSDSSDSEVVSFPVVVLFLPTNTTHLKNTNKIPICTWWRANAPPLCLIFNLNNSWTPWSLQLRVFLIPRCLSAQGVRMFCLIPYRWIWHTIRKLLFTEVFSLHNIIYNKIIITVYPLLHKMKENEDDLERILAELIAQNAELEVCYIWFSIPVFLKFHCITSNQMNLTLVWLIENKIFLKFDTLNFYF